MRQVLTGATRLYCAVALMACESNAPRNPSTISDRAANPKSDSSAAWVASPIDATSVDGSWFIADAEQDAVIVIGANGMLRHRFGRRGS